MAGDMTGATSCRMVSGDDADAEAARIRLYITGEWWQDMPCAAAWGRHCTTLQLHRTALHYTTEPVLTRLGSRAMSRCCWDLQGRKEGSKDTCGITVASRPSYKPACVLVHVLVVVLSEACHVTGGGTLDNTGSRLLAGPSTSACC
jgi:hypothetical protein